MTHTANGRHALEQRRLDARIRTARTPQEQIAHLDKMFGVGQGAVKERAKLAQRLADPITPKKTPVKDKQPKKGRQPKGKRGKSNA